MPGLECPICLGTLRAAVETDCGHAFCAECLEVSLARSGGTCPVCRSNVTSSHPSYTLRELAENAQGQSGDAAAPAPAGDTGASGSSGPASGAGSGNGNRSADGPAQRRPQAAAAAAAAAAAPTPTPAAAPAPAPAAAQGEQLWGHVGRPGGSTVVGPRGMMSSFVDDITTVREMPSELRNKVLAMVAITLAYVFVHDDLIPDNGFFGILDDLFLVIIVWREVHKLCLATRGELDAHWLR